MWKYDDLKNQDLLILFSWLRIQVAWTSKTGCCVLYIISRCGTHNSSQNLKEAEDFTQKSLPRCFGEAVTQTPNFQCWEVYGAGPK